MVCPLEVLFTGIVCLAVAGSAWAAEPVRLELDLEATKDLSIEPAGNGAYAAKTTGSDPYVYTVAKPEPLPLGQTPVLAFEYFTTTPTGNLQVYMDPPTSEMHSTSGEGLGHSEGWTTYALDLGQAKEAWPDAPVRLRLDFGKRSGRSFQIRNIVLRAPTPREIEMAATRAAREQEQARRDQAMQDYLDVEFPCVIREVKVLKDTIVVQGHLDGHESALYLAEAPLHALITEEDAFVSFTPLAGNGTFRTTLDRYTQNGQCDRLLSRWAVVAKEGDEVTLLSHAHYADTVQSLNDLPLEKLRGRKGIGGFSKRRGHTEDLDDLGITSVTVNIWLHFMRPGPSEKNIAFDYNGKTYYADRGSIESLDETFLEAAKRDLITLAIILVPKDGPMKDVMMHPDCDPAGIYSMANVTSEEGVDLYAAAIDLLARRYSRPDKKFGRIHHYIVHNEVDAGWVWTNAGEKTPLLFMDLYHKSMRTVHLIARKYNPHAQAFISLTHYWNWTSDRHFYLSKELLDILLDFSDKEGDFEWAVAHHPYPESLFEPRTWEDKKVDFTLDTPLITYKNIEVLAAWVRQPRTWFKGDRPRVVYLTEQGLNSKSYSEEDLLNQAAGMAYAWKKLEVLPEIRAFQYHNWMDGRGEGGLRLGLRKFPDFEDDPAGIKPIWHVFEKLDTDEEDEACAFALKHINLDNWDDARHTEPIK